MSNSKAIMQVSNSDFQLESFIFNFINVSIPDSTFFGKTLFEHRGMDF